MDDWTKGLDDPTTAWIQRLWHRGEQPGVVRLSQARDTADRLTQKGGPPLADEVARRYVAVMALQQQMPPIIYAEPMPVVSNKTLINPVPNEASPPLPVVAPRPQTAPISSTPLPTVNPPLPVVKTPNRRPAAAATPSHPARPMDPPLPDPHPSSNPADTPTTPPITPLLVVRPQIQAQFQQRSLATPATPFPTKPSIVPTQVNKSVISSARPITRTMPAAAAATAVTSSRPAVLPHLSQEREKSDAAASHTPKHAAAAIVPPVSTLPAQQAVKDKTPLPVVREQFTASPAPVPSGMNQPLPLAQPPMQPISSAGGIVQRKPHAHATSQSSPSRQPTPAPNRMIRSNSVVQRAPQSSITTTPSNNDSNTSEEVFDALPNVDMDELVDKVHRQFLRRLSVEGERRGKTSWP